MTLKSDAKFVKKPRLVAWKMTRNLTDFDESTQKSPNWNFDGILLPKAENI